MARLMVVDDDAGVREFLVDALRDAGHSVAAATTAETALATLRSEGFDLVVTDLRLPGLSGLELLRRIRGEQPETEVLVLTAHGSVDAAVEAMKLGAFDFLQKPLASPEELELVVERGLERRSLRSLRDRAEREETAPVALGYGDPAMELVESSLRRVARTEATVVLLGESGTGKEVAARAIHAWSPRAAGPFVAVNCAAISEALLESELFGHERGAFTGAVAARRGRLELAAGGTFFLDEVAELRPELQAKLLRVLQERRYERVGGTRTLVADVRWVAATHRDLDALVAAGAFREDLYHRLMVFPVRLPPLRERSGDIGPLAAVLLRAIAREIGRPDLRLDSGATAALATASWPGNVRELRNVLERAAILADSPVLTAADLRGLMTPQQVPESARVPRPPTAEAPEAAAELTLAALERAAIVAALAAVGGHRRRAAERLGIGLRTLYEKLQRYRIGEPAPPEGEGG